MPVAPRTIGFLSEVLHPPQTPDAGVVQRLHDGMFRSGDPLYRNFAVTHEGCLLSNPAARPGSSSQVAFLGDRLRFGEEHTGLTVDDFAHRLRTVVEQYCAARSFPLLVGQVVTIRTLVTPRNPSAGLEFMRQGVLGLGEELADFGRPAAGLGVRLTFVPQPDEPNAFAVRIESVPNDPKALWIEVQATFPAIQVAQGLERLEENVHSAYTYATGRAVAFLERFDGTRA